MRSRPEFLFLAMLACADGDVDTAESDLPEPAPLTSVTGACPDLSEPGIKTFESSGKTRRAGIYFPSAPEPGMSVMFAWHGLATADLLPMEQLVVGFDLAEYAEEENTVVIVPEAQPTNLLGMDVLLWGILGSEHEGEDLAMFDDLRTCVADAFDVDLRKVASWGHSGGGLWTSMLLMDRSTMLASGVSSSGGVNLEVPILGSRLQYRSPERDVPAMLITGGDQDVWPDASFPIIVFEETTDFLEERLVADGSYVVRCKHDLGHNYLPNWFWGQVKRWIKNHTYGAPSPFEEGESLNDACQEAVFDQET